MKLDTKFYKQGYTGLPPWAKGTIAVIIVGGIAFAVYKLFKKASDLVDPDKKAEKDVIKSVDKEIKTELNKGETLSKPLSVYQSTANTIAKLLDGCEMIESERKVMALIINTVKKPIDWLTLQKAFDTRKISDCGTWGLSKTEYELAGLLKEQLDKELQIPFKAENFYYDPAKSGNMTAFGVLNLYLRKIGVTI